MYALRLRSNGYFLSIVDFEGLTFTAFIEKALILYELADCCELLTILDNCFYLDDYIEIYPLSIEDENILKKGRFVKCMK